MVANEVLRNLTQQEGRHLGDFAGWSLNGAVRQEAARQAARDHGLEDDLGFPRVGAASAYRRAVTDAVKGGKKDEAPLEVVRVSRPDDEEAIVHVFIERSVIAQAIANGSVTQQEREFVAVRGVQHAELCRTRFNKIGEQTGVPVPDLVTFSNDHPVAGRVRAAYEKLCVVYTADDIRTAFQRAFVKWGGAPVLAHGGLWYLPNVVVDKVGAWKAFMMDIFQQALTIPVFDTQETIDALRQITRDSLERQLEDVRESLAKLASGDHRTRMTTLEKRVEEFDTLRARAELYERLLHHELGDLKASMDQAQKALVQAITTAKQ